jgi:hypothetical protein
MLNTVVLTELSKHKSRSQNSLLGRKAASTRLNTTFRGLAPSPSSGKTDLPEDGDGASLRNVVFKRIDAAVRPRRLY